MNRIIFLIIIAFVCSCGDGKPEPEEINELAANLPPVAIGGPDRTITLPDTAHVLLDGTRSYDPEKKWLTLKWVQLSGPALVSFNDNHTKAGDALAVFGTSGKYQFQLTAKDDRHGVTDTVEVIVTWASECNLNREIVTAETVSVSFSSPTISNAPAVAIGPDKLVFVGGMLSEPFWPDDPPPTFSASIHLYDMKLNTWAESRMTQPKGAVAIVIAGNKLFIGGGVTDAGVITGEVEIHDLTSRTLTKAELSIPRMNITVAASNGKVVFAGGNNIVGTASDVVDIYDIASNSWSTAKLSQPRVNMSPVVSDNKIYFVGGSSSTYYTGSLNSIDIYDMVTGSWSVQKLSRQGYDFQTAMLGNKMVISGGRSSLSSFDPLSRIEFVNLSDWSSSVDCIQFPSFSGYGPKGNNLNLAVIGDKIYFGSSESINVYDGLNKTWKYARLLSYHGILFTYQGQLHGLRFKYAGLTGQYEVIKILI
ncbi:MAG TPA: hypothetical protein VLA58_04435 [Chitinophagaceae bacterium]|nr:hypothetical protein [Chitinophagaceae bacterium]